MFYHVFLFFFFTMLRGALLYEIGKHRQPRCVDTNLDQIWQLAGLASISEWRKFRVQSDHFYSRFDSGGESGVTAIKSSGTVFSGGQDLK